LNKNWTLTRNEPVKVTTDPATILSRSLARAVLLTLLLPAALSCGSGQESDSRARSGRLAPSPVPEGSPEFLAKRWLEGRSTMCMTNSDCHTNLCDRSTVLWATEEPGLCVSLFRARARWQRLVVAESISEMVAQRPDLQDSVWELLLQRWPTLTEPDQLEGALVLARKLGGPRAQEFLEEAMGSGSSDVAIHAGISAGKLSLASGFAAVADASASPMPVLRLHAAWAAGALCTPESVSVLDDLAEDVHPAVKQGALLALANCTSAEARSLRQRLSTEYSQDPQEAEPGTWWLLGARKSR